MKLAVTAEKNNPASGVDPRFGRCAWLLVHDTDTGSWSATDNAENRDAAGGAGPRTAALAAELGVSTVLTGNGPGNSAWQVLQQHNITVYTGAAGLSAEEAVAAFTADSLTEFAPS